MSRFPKQLCILFLFLAIVLPAPAVFAQEQTFTVLLSEEEKAYIAQKNTITVVFSPNKGPIQYTDSNGMQKGISFDMLKWIADITGLKFNYVSISGANEMKAAIDTGKAQILAGIPEEEAVRNIYAVDFSMLYMECTYSILLNRGSSITQSGDLTLALTTGLDIPKGFENIKNIKRYNTIEECILAIHKKEADFTYGNSYVLEFYSQGYQFQNLCIVQFSGDTQRICFGISQQTDPLLSGILDKAISHIGSRGIFGIIVNNVAASTQPATLASSVSQNPRLSLAVGTLILFLIIILTLSVLVNIRRKGKLVQLEHQRHLLLSEAAREYFYEYNFQTDTLILNDDTAELFGTKKVFKKWHRLLKQSATLKKTDLQKLEQLYKTPPENLTAKCSSSQSVELELPLPGDKKHWFRITHIALFEEGIPAFSIGKLVDIEEEHHAYHELMKKSVSDSLTGLYNTMAAKEFINHSLKTLHSGVLFMFDLDYFKQVNDQFGHQTGDRVIKEFAEILKDSFRENDILARVGGDEFIVFTQSTSASSFIDKKCMSLQEKANKIKLGDGYVQTISIGVAKSKPDSTYEKLFQQADAALYYVKEHGRGGYHVFE